MAKRGPKSKLTQKLIDEYETLLITNLDRATIHKAATSGRHAAALLDIPISTHNHWIAKGKDDKDAGADTLHAKLLDIDNRAREKRSGMVKSSQFLNAINGDTTAQRNYLQLVDGAAEKRELTGPDGGHIQIGPAQPNVLTPEQLQTLQQMLLENQKQIGGTSDSDNAAQD
jgi:hypothetical protein